MGRLEPALYYKYDCNNLKSVTVLIILKMALFSVYYMTLTEA